MQARTTRTLGASRGETHGLVIAGHGGAEIITRQNLAGVMPGPARVRIDPARLVAFRDGWRVEPAAGGAA